MKNILDENGMIDSAKLRRYTFVFCSVCLIALILNITVLLNAPLSFLTSKWEVIVSPLCLIFAIDIFRQLKSVFKLKSANKKTL